MYGKQIYYNRHALHYDNDAEMTMIVTLELFQALGDKNEGRADPSLVGPEVIWTLDSHGESGFPRHITHSKFLQTRGHFDGLSVGEDSRDSTEEPFDQDIQ